MAREDTGALDLLSYLAVEPTFPIKLFHLVCNTLTNGAISWTQSGDAFVITDPDTFAREILPTYFKHNNIRSLERQLNIYGFKRRTDLQTHVRKHLEFSHEKFRRDEPWLLTQIKRCEAKRSDLPMADDARRLMPSMPPLRLTQPPLLGRTLIT